LLPRLLFLERFDRFRNMRLIVQRGITKAQRQSLEILGIPRERVIEFDGHHWQVERLYYVCPGLCGNPTSLPAQWLRNRFAPNGTGSRRLYVSRNDAKKRRVVNEADLLDALLPLGFEVVTLAGMSFAEQVRLFSEAKVVVGPHGAGFTNMVFAAPGAVVVELFSPTYINGCYWALANASGHRYGFSVGSACDDDIRVDVHKLIRLFTLLEKNKARAMGTS
jgi:capsular polysaccharide biosynthesis protein